MIFKRERVLYPKSRMVRGYREDIRQSGGYYETPDRLFPIAYEEKVKGVSMCTYAHYHPLAITGQQWINFVG